MKRKSFSVVELESVAVLDAVSNRRKPEMRYETAQCVADMFNQYMSPQRKFVVVRDGHPVRRREGRMRRYYENLAKLQA
jgi:hypothetical protein